MLIIVIYKILKEKKWRTSCKDADYNICLPLWAICEERYLIGGALNFASQICLNSDNLEQSIKFVNTSSKIETWRVIAVL